MMCRFNCSTDFTWNQHSVNYKMSIIAVVGGSPEGEDPTLAAMQMSLPTISTWHWMCSLVPYKIIAQNTFRSGSRLCFASGTHVFCQTVLRGSMGMLLLAQSPFWFKWWIVYYTCFTTHFIYSDISSSLFICRTKSICFYTYLWIFDISIVLTGRRIDYIDKPISCATYLHNYNYECGPLLCKLLFSVRGAK